MVQPYGHEIELRIAPDAKWVWVSLDRRLPQRYTATVRTDELADIEVTLAVEVDDFGRLACRRLSVAAQTYDDRGRVEKWRPVNGALLRKLPVERLLDATVGAIVDNYGGGEMTAAEVEEFRSTYRRKPRAGTKEEAAFLAEVATTYREAHQQGKPPRRAVERAFRAHQQTAAGWISLARKRGYLGKARPRRAGEEEQ